MKSTLFRLEVFITAIYASLLLVLPFSWVKKKVLIKSFETKKSPPWVSTKYLLNISYVIPRLEKYLPWTYQCYQQALTARLLLNRRNQANALSIGHKLHAGKMVFHAWTSCQELVITGYQEVLSYHVINTFD